jgi:hypothetical protein
MSPIWKMIIVTILMIVFYTSFGIIMNLEHAHFAQLVENFQEHPMAITKAILTARGDSIAISRDVKDIVLVKNSEHRRILLTEIEFHEKAIDQNMGIVHERITGERGKELIEKAIKLVEEQKDYLKRVVKAVLSGNNELTAHLADTEGSELMKKIEEAMTKVANYAETESMEYQVDSINALKRAKVLLYSAGLIIAILSIVFALVIGNSLVKVLKNTKDFVRRASSVPIDLTARLKTPSPTGNSEALNDFFESIGARIKILFNKSSELKQVRSSLEQHRFANTIEELSQKFENVVKNIASLTLKWETGEHGFKPLLDLIHRINSDLILMAQITTSQEMIIERLKVEKKINNDEVNQLLDTLQTHTASLRRSAERGSLSIEKFTAMLLSRLDSFSQLQAISGDQASLSFEIKYLVNRLKENDIKLQHMSEIQQDIDTALSSFKLT